jgi:predicted nucleotide-binding protein (sugar kinase/HSP70/actin superfamily)
LLLEEYIRTYGGMYIPPNPEPPKAVETAPVIQEPADCVSPLGRLSGALIKERERREKLVAEQTLVVKSSVVPIRATFYLFLMGFSNSFVFIRRPKDMLRLLTDMEQGR